MDWLGLGLAVAGIGLALVPLAFEDHIPKNFHTPLLYAGIAFVIFGIAVCLRAPWRKASLLLQRRFGPMPVALVYRALKETKAFKEGHELKGFNALVAMLVSLGWIKLLGVPGGPSGRDRRLVEIPSRHLESHFIYIIPPDLASTYNKDTNIFDLPSQPVEGRYFNIHVSRNFFRMLQKLTIQEKLTIQGGMQPDP